MSAFSYYFISVAPWYLLVMARYYVGHDGHAAITHFDSASIELWNYLFLYSRFSDMFPDVQLVREVQVNYLYLKMSLGSKWNSLPSDIKLAPTISSF